MRVITDDERRARLALRHALAPEARAATPEAATVAMTCLHATEPASIYMSAFARTGASRAVIDAALHEERSIVRQLAMRRTVFVFPRDVLPFVWASAAARVAGQLAARLAKEVEGAELAKDGTAWVRDTSEAVLARVREAPTTTAQLRAAVPALESRLILSPGTKYGGDFPIAPRLLSTLAASGRILRGCNDGSWKLSRPYWTATEEWLGEAPATVTSEEGYTELVRRWLWTFGPGTEADIVWWLGATKGAVRRALAEVAAVEVQLEDGAAAWLHPDDTETVASPKPWAALLPALDPTTMGWKERSFYLGSHKELMFDSNGNAGPTAWWDGRIVGGWTQDAEGAVVIHPAATLPRAAERPLADAAEALTAWLDGDVVNTIYQSPLGRSAKAATGG